MRPIARTGLVAAGYVLAFLIACAAVAIQGAFTDDADKLASGGMSAFGDTLLFIAVFGAASIPATAGALFLLRPYPALWRGLSIVALAIAATGIAASIGFSSSRSAEVGSALQAFSALAIIRFLGSPFLAAVFFLCGLFAPMRGSRIALFVAAAMEAVTFAWAVIIWFRPFG